MAPYGAVVEILAGQAGRSGLATVTISALVDAWRTRDLLASILVGIATP